MGPGETGAMPAAAPCWGATKVEAPVAMKGG